MHREICQMYVERTSAVIWHIQIFDVIFYIENLLPNIVYIVPTEM